MRVLRRKQKASIVKLPKTPLKQGCNYANLSRIRRGEVGRGRAAFPRILGEEWKMKHNKRTVRASLSLLVCASDIPGNFRQHAVRLPGGGTVVTSPAETPPAQSDRGAWSRARDRPPSWQWGSSCATKQRLPRHKGIRSHHPGRPVFTAMSTAAFGRRRQNYDSTPTP